ncbi:efflux RND transporter periplasmic adaptor subunit [Burkholderia sp. L27(2015)]|uniref:efflux RND transporter periplasmic adaptor subunit n=1 Tax=Burkholderia sp. L27(2015) TaxID=1641858 RepID=UPI0020B13EE7|nr:efflux RND transporter periplasmic adaptor subunit [Burkholderia sp. L27(2015)]
MKIVIEPHRYLSSRHRAIEHNGLARSGVGPRRLRLAALVSVAVCLSVGLAACHKAEPAVITPRSVVVLPVQAATHAAAVSVPAEIQARYVTPLAFRVAGQVRERLVHLGDTVKQGQIVARLDPADSQRNLASSQADLASATQRLNSARVQLERDTVQAREKLISALQLEQTQDAEAAAQAQFKDARERAGLAANQLDYTVLRAERDGVITAEQADTGAVLSPGQPVFSMAWSGAIDVVGEVGQSQIGLIRPGASAQLVLAALPDHTLRATVREVSPAADPQSRTFRVKLTLDTHDPAVRLGMSGDLRIAAADGDAAHAGQAGGVAHADQASDVVHTDPARFTIPATALFHQGDQPAVWVVSAIDHRLSLRPVSVLSYAQRSVTVAGGLKAGDTIVVQGVHTLSAGDTVKEVAPLHPEDFAL